MNIGPVKELNVRAVKKGKEYGSYLFKLVSIYDIYQAGINLSLKKLTLIFIHRFDRENVWLS